MSRQLNLNVKAFRGLAVVLICLFAANSFAEDKQSPYSPAAKNMGTPVSSDTAAQAKAVAESRWIVPTTAPKPINSNSVGQKSNLTWSATCTDASGKQFKQPETGYTECLQHVSNDSKARRTEVKTNAADDSNKAAAGAGVSFKFGK